MILRRRVRADQVAITFCKAILRTGGSAGGQGMTEPA
jgi:hypothetical protein